ncbi:MAG: hypothetical protein VYD14_03185, partial [SAR324 cluster bacterium]|nr:hypothetical protein [SAR324 cluster bacterium]
KHILQVKSPHSCKLSPYYGEEYSIAIRALGTTDKVTFFSKEKQLTDGRDTSQDITLGGFAPQMSVWPNISFK